MSSASILFSTENTRKNHLGITKNITGSRAVKLFQFRRDTLYIVSYLTHYDTAARNSKWSETSQSIVLRGIAHPHTQTLAREQKATNWLKETMIYSERFGEMRSSAIRFSRDNIFGAINALQNRAPRESTSSAIIGLSPDLRRDDNKIRPWQRFFESFHRVRLLQLVTR